MKIDRRISTVSLVVIAMVTLSTLSVYALTYKDGLRCTSPDEPRTRVIHFCSKVIKADDMSTEQLALAHYHRGIAYNALGQYSDAISDYNQAMMHGYADTMILCDRGNAYGALGQYDKAAADCQRAAIENPNESTAWSSTCKWYRRDGQPSDAEAACARAKELDPNCEVCTSLGVTIVE